MKNKSIQIISYASATLLISSVALCLYTISILNPLDYYNKYDLQSGLFIAGIELLLFLTITTVFLKKIIQKKWRIVLVVLFYIIMLQELFFEIAANLQGEFGVTWTATEIRYELVIDYEYTKLILIISAITYFLILGFIKKKITNLKTTLNEKQL